jgi:DNA/RNA-binding domain of Phe-tRNA-synthetase-like protein
VPAAYRVFHRHIGLDPDIDRTPIEQAAVERLLEGGHRSKGRVADALLLALLETGVAISAFDADAIDGPVGLREARRGERLGTRELSPQLPPGRIVIADADHALGELFGRPHENAVPQKKSRRLVLVCVQVPGVPQIHVEESLWTCIEALSPSG